MYRGKKFILLFDINSTPHHMFSMNKKCFGLRDPQWNLEGKASTVSLFDFFQSLREEKKRGRQQREPLPAPCTTLHSRSVQQRADSLRATSRAAPHTILNYFTIVCLCVRYKHFSYCGDLNLFTVIWWRIFVWWGWGKVWFSLNSTGQGCATGSS